jgi:hypothetical protein
MKISSQLANNFDYCSAEKNKLLRRKLTGIRLVNPEEPQFEYVSIICPSQD